LGPECQRLSGLQIGIERGRRVSQDKRPEGGRGPLGPKKLQIQSGLYRFVVAHSMEAAVPAGLEVAILYA
jgi:hypothetical protein